jgi:hypothetical protein
MSLVVCKGELSCRPSDESPALTYYVDAGAIAGSYVLHVYIGFIQIKIIYELKKGNPRDSVYGLYWIRLGKGSG